MTDETTDAAADAARRQATEEAIRAREADIAMQREVDRRVKAWAGESIIQNTAQQVRAEMQEREIAGLRADLVTERAKNAELQNAIDTMTKPPA